MFLQNPWAFERGILWAITPSHENPAVSPRVASLLCEVDRESAGALAEAMGLRKPDPIVRRFATGRRCFTAWIENRIAAYGWVSRGAECIGEQEREIRLEPDEAYIWDCATLPAYRGQRLYSALLSRIVADLRGEGARRVWIGSSASNHPSVRGFANAGFRPVLTLTHVRLFNARSLWVSRHPGAPEPLAVAARRALIAADERVWGPLVASRSRQAQLQACTEVEM